MTVFFSQLINGLSLGSIYALIALGYSMVYGIILLLNFAHGDVIMVGAYMSWFVVKPAGSWPGPPLCCATIITCTLLGVVIEKIAYTPLRSAPRISPVITAIGVSFFLEYTAELILGCGLAKVIPAYTPTRPSVWQGAAGSYFDHHAGGHRVVHAGAHLSGAKD